MHSNSRVEKALGMSLKDGVDSSRFDVAMEACRVLAEHARDDGLFGFQNTWGPEGILYTYFRGVPVLLEGYRLSGEQALLDAVVLLLDYLPGAQLPSGLWANGCVNGGEQFVLSREDQKRSWKDASACGTASVLVALARYQKITGDDRYTEIAERAIDGMLASRDPDKGYIAGPEELVASDPMGYQMFNYLGLHGWLEKRTDITPAVERLAEFVLAHYRSMDEHTMLLMKASHAIVCLSLIDPSIAEEARRSIEELLHNALYKCPTIRGGYGHRDGIRGIVNSEANMRGTCILAWSCRLYDLATNTTTFTAMPEYKDLSYWIDSMKAERGFYEYQLEDDKVPRGQSSVSMALPCQWIFGLL